MKIRKSLAVLATLGAGLTLATAGLTGTAHAAQLSPNYGFDGSAHLIVSGGSDTTYKAMTAIADIYDTSSIAGCPTNTSAGTTNPALNQCNPSTTPVPGGTTGAPLNFDRDTVVNASPTGSGAGIASLNGYNGATQISGGIPYQGTTGSVNFARSSRAPSTTGGNGPSGNELTSDTFWGFAEDGVEVFGFGTHAGVQLTPAQLYSIWSCQVSTWGQLLGTSDTAPIVPFAMNSASGTYATFNSFLVNQGGAPTGFSVDTAATGAGATYPASASQCVRQIKSGAPFENDVKPLFQDVAANGGGIGSNAYNDPNNWIWFGSFGLLSAFPYDNNFTSGTTTYTGVPDAVQNVGGDYVTPSQATIGNLSYPITRTLYHVTLKTDADCPKTSGSCNFSANPGPSITTTTGGTTTDLNVQGGTGGTSGAVREFTRYLCRSSALQDPVDPYTGNNAFTEVLAAKGASGFVAVPSTIRTAGSSCLVQS